MIQLCHRDRTHKLNVYSTAIMKITPERMDILLEIERYKDHVLVWLHLFMFPDLLA